MEQLDVRTVRLAPMRVASVHAFGASPEHLAWEKLKAWATPRGLFDNATRGRIFGFNNPGPSAGSPNYGYEFWLAVGPEVEVDGEATAKTFDGGLYAVTNCPLVGEVIPQVWQRLVAWLETSRYRLGRHQWLEEHLGAVDQPDQASLDLYMPLVE